MKKEGEDHLHSGAQEDEMGFDKLNSIVNRLFFLGAFMLLGLALLERVVNEFGYTILRGFYTAGRLLEFATILLVFVMAMLLRQVREELKRRNGPG